ncbi:GP, class II peroxidase [Crepidotus variabilis]|uniref:Peroxidase n=1 Tax=Crepidotus variabilis TaxID=179855 RepID=A0A9P6E7L9_9AGAR|nr:GP, class II peroxidase [Crepidotus variabilis]
MFAFSSYAVILLSLSRLGLCSSNSPKRAPENWGESPSDSRCSGLLPLMQALQQNVFNEKCGSMVHKALRATFHDSIAYSQSQSTGAADGSLFAFSEVELTYRANGGLREYVATMKPYAEHYGISSGDLLYFAAAVGLTNCVGGPRLDVFIGRPAAVGPSPDGMIPGPTQSVDAILARMADAGFSASELVALMASHSVAASDNIDPTIPETPIDSTPGCFDSQFYIETSLKGTTFPGTGNNAERGEVESPSKRQIRMKSDFELARDPRTSCQWQSYATDHSRMQADFKMAMTKLMTLGQNMGDLINCSDVIPQPESLKSTMKPHFSADHSIDDVDQSCPNSPFPDLPSESKDDIPGKQDGGSDDRQNW